MADANPNPVPKKGLRLWLKILLGLLLLVLAVVVFVVASISNAKNWYETSLESSPSKFAAPTLSPEEEQGIDRFIQDYFKAYREKQDLEVVFTPAQFNAFVERDIASKRKRGKVKPSDPEGAQLALEGEELVLRLALPAEGGRYRNFEIRGALSIENRKVSCTLDSVRLGGREAPWLAMHEARKAIGRQMEAYTHPEPGAQDHFFEHFKLLRLEGGKLHVIVDGRRLPVPEE